MRSAQAVAVVALLIASTGALQPAAGQGSAELAGGWIVTRWTSADGAVNSSPQRGLFVFTQSGNYSIMYVPGTEPRPRYSGETMTDAETLAAYGSLVANSGRYTVEGDTITYEAFVAKDPNYMADFNVQTRANATRMTFRIDNGILTLKWLSGRSVGQSATLRRPGTGPGARGNRIDAATR